MLKRPGSFWVTSWQEYAKHAWQGAWVCSAFRKESGAELASELIRDAVACTRWHFGCRPLPHGMITFVDRTKVRGKRDPGYCYLKAGFVRCGETKKGLLALRLAPCDMPPPHPPLRTQESLF